MFNLLSNSAPDFLVIQTKGNKYELCFPKIKFKMMLNYGSDEDEYVVPTKSVRQVMFLLSTETHRRATTGNTKSREVARALEALLPRRRPAISVTRPEVLWKTRRAT